MWMKTKYKFTLITNSCETVALGRIGGIKQLRIKSWSGNEKPSLTAMLHPGCSCYHLSKKIRL